MLFSYKTLVRPHMVILLATGSASHVLAPTKGSSEMSIKGLECSHRFDTEVLLIFTSKRYEQKTQQQFIDIYGLGM